MGTEVMPERDGEKERIGAARALLCGGLSEGQQVLDFRALSAMRGLVGIV